MAQSESLPKTYDEWRAFMKELILESRAIKKQEVRKIEKKKLNQVENENPFVRKTVGKEKRILIANWRDHPCLKADVLIEDGIPVNKRYLTASRREIEQLRLILKKADEEGKGQIGVSILRTGAGLDTQYIVKELPPSYKEIVQG